MHLLLIPWWRHQMETFSALLALCAGNSPVTGEFPSQRPETRSFDVFFDLRLNKRLSKQKWGWWFETPTRSLWRNWTYRVITSPAPAYTTDSWNGHPVHSKKVCSWTSTSDSKSDCSFGIGCTFPWTHLSRYEANRVSTKLGVFMQRNGFVMNKLEEIVMESSLLKNSICNWTLLIDWSFVHFEINIKTTTVQIW